MTVKLEKVDDKTAYENLLVKYAELENQIADIKANCDLAIEGRDVKIKELKDHLAEEVELHLHAEEYIKELEKENAELKSEKGCETCTKFDEVKLTRATKLLNEFMRISKASDEDFEHDYSELIRGTEQFLQEIEK